MDQPSSRISVATDMTLLCAYDPKGMKDFVRKSRAWVYDVKDNDYGKLDPVKSGRIADDERSIENASDASGGRTPRGRWRGPPRNPPGSNTRIVASGGS